MLDYKITISVGAIILLIILLIVMILCSEGYINTQRNERNESDEIRENFPQSAMNVLYSDANGNLSSTNDLGLQNLTTIGNAQIGGNLSVLRKRLTFSNADDINHAIYNNVYNIDGQGGWDGMKMNVYEGLDVRTGNANGVTPTTMLSVRNGSVSTTGALSAGSISTTGSLSAGNTSVGTLSAGNTSVGGLSASSISTNGNLGISGTLAIPAYTNVKNTLDDLYAKISALDTKFDTLNGKAVKYDDEVYSYATDGWMGRTKYRRWGHCDACTNYGSDFILSDMENNATTNASTTRFVFKKTPATAPIN